MKTRPSGGIYKHYSSSSLSAFGRSESESKAWLHDYSKVRYPSSGYLPELAF